MFFAFVLCRWIYEANRRPRLAAHPDGSTTSKPRSPPYVVFSEVYRRRAGIPDYAQGRRVPVPRPAVAARRLERSAGFARVTRIRGRLCYTLGGVGRDKFIAFAVTMEGHTSSVIVANAEPL